MSTGTPAWAGIGLILMASMGCPSTTSTLTVRVQSGLRAGHEVRFVGVSLFRGSVPCSSTASTLADEGLALVASDQSALGLGTRTVAELGGLAAGTYTVRVQARRPGAGRPSSGSVLIERCVVTSVTRTRVLRVPLTTDCIGVTCPAPAGSPAFDQCLNGRCVDPRCDPGDPSTTSFCCDRSALGSACDEVPTVCRATTDCTPTLECSGAPACVDGVCVEPPEDACPDGQYCDALGGSCEPDPSLGSSDAGPRDAGLDASLDLDAPSPDALAVPDAASLDAVVPPADTYTDATTERPGEDCTLAGDEDLDGRLDCADTECVSTVMCAAGCTLFTAPPPRPTAAIPLPAHWYRVPESLLSNARGEVCAFRDLVGNAHFFAIDLPITGVRNFGTSGRGLAIEPGQLLTTPSNLGVGLEGDYSAFVVVGPDDPETLRGDFTMLRTWAPGSATEHFSWRVTYAAGPRYFTLGLHESTFDAGSTASYPFNMEGVIVDSIVAGDDLARRVRYYQGVDSARTPLLAGGAGIAGPPAGPEPTRAEIGPSDSAGMRLAEIVVYDRALNMTELSQLRIYLGGRYTGP